MDFRILKITNLIPVKIDYIIDDKEITTYAYIDYTTQAVSGVEDIPPELYSEFQKGIKSFLSRPKLDRDVPIDVYKQYTKGSSFNINDYFTEELSVQLKGKKINA